MKCARGMAAALGWIVLILPPCPLSAQTATPPATEPSSPAAAPPAGSDAAPAAPPPRRVLTVPIISGPSPGPSQPVPPPSNLPPTAGPTPPPRTLSDLGSGSGPGGRTTTAVPTLPPNSAWGNAGPAPGAPPPMVPQGGWSSPPATATPAPTFAPPTDYGQAPPLPEDIPIEMLLNEIKLPRLNVVSNRFYEVTGPDFPAAQAVLAMTEKLYDVLKTLYFWPPEKVQQIQVQLVPSAIAAFPQPFIIQSEPNGHRAALIRWDAQTKFSDVCLAISSATLERLATWNSGPPAGARTPFWLKLATAQALEAAMHPAYRDGLSEQAQFMPVFTLRQIMEATPDQSPEVVAVLGVNSYWLMKFLETRLAGAPQVRALFGALAAGAAPAPALRTAIPNEFTDGANMELWWSLGYRKIIAARDFPIQTFTESHEMIIRYVTLEQTISGNRQTATLDAGWVARRNPAVREQINTRVGQLAALARQVNPVYRNSLAAAGVCLQLMQGTDEPAFREAWKKFQEEFRQAEAIEMHALQALASP